MELTFERVSFSYRARTPVLRGIDASILPGCVTVILGPNGAGKSTLLRVGVGSIRPTSGRVVLGGRDLASWSARERARHVALVPQHGSVAFAFSVAEVVGLGLYARGGSDRVGGPVGEALAMVGLTDRAAEPYGVLSAGQRQRATLARAMAQLGTQGVDRRGQVLLADEPISAMDPGHALASLGMLREVARAGAAVGVVLHDLALAHRVADRAIVVAGDGSLAAVGEAGAVLREEVLGPVLGVGLGRLRWEDGTSAGLAARGAGGF